MEQTTIIDPFFISCLMMINRDIRQRKAEYAPNGLLRTRTDYTKPQQVPGMVLVSGPLVEMLEAAKQLNLTESLTWRFNIARLIQWTIEDIRELNGSVLGLDPSQLNVALTIMLMMEINQLLRAKKSEEAGMVHASDLMNDLLTEALRQCKKCSQEIKNETCRVVSENCRKSKNLLLAKRNNIITGPSVLQSSFLELELNCVFGNLLLNFRRLGRHVEDSSENRPIFRRALKALELKMYYLTMALPKTEEYVRRLADDIFHPDRSQTFVHLLFQTNGLFLLHKYFREAPLCQLREDMKLISVTYHRQLTERG